MLSLVAAAITAATVGTNVHLPPADTLELARDLGVGWVRIDFNWDLAEPANDQWNWAPFDAVIDDARARGLQVYATLGYGAAWASVSGDRRGDGPHNDVPNAAEYAAFVTAAVGRYQGRVAVWGTWNEPNLGDFFEGTRDEWITNAYAPAIDAIRAACPACTVAGPELATIGDQYDDYLQAALRSRRPTIIAAHIYAAFPEDDPQAGLTKDSFYNKLEMRRVVGPFMGPPSIREVALAEGAGAVPVWITETGRQATVGNAGELASQRQFTQRVLDAMAARPWWGGVIFYELSEEHPDGMWPDIHWGLALRTGGPDATWADNFQTKPAYDYLKQRLAAPPPGPDAGAGVDGGAGLDGAATDPDAGAGDGDAGVPGADDGSGGCGCRAGGADRAGLGLALISLGVILRRRRRRLR